MSSRKVIASGFLFQFCNPIRDCTHTHTHTHTHARTNVETVEWFEVLAIVTINTILHLEWFLVLPLVTEKIDLSLRLRCVVIKKGPKYLMWYEFLCTGRGYTLAARMWFVRNNLSIVSWFIYEVCSLKHFSAVICLKCAILKNLEK